MVLLALLPRKRRDSRAWLTFCHHNYLRYRCLPSPRPLSCCASGRWRCVPRQGFYSIDSGG